MPRITLHYWAGARAAAGVEREEFEAVTVAEALAHAVRQRADSRLASVVAVCSLLRDGVTLHEQDISAPLSSDVEIEVLPPFAGG